jgi:hypothetical protein
MKAVELWDGDRFFLTLADVLGALPSRAQTSLWEVSDYVYPDGKEYFDTGADGDQGIERLANSGKRVAGDDLMIAARSTSQIIWGTFRGFDTPEASVAWIALHAIDSTFWRIETRDITTRQALMKTFKDVRLKQ